MIDQTRHASSHPLFSEHTTPDGSVGQRALHKFHLHAKAEVPCAELRKGRAGKTRARIEPSIRRACFDQRRDSCKAPQSLANETRTLFRLLRQQRLFELISDRGRVPDLRRLARETANRFLGCVWLTRG